MWQLICAKQVSTGPTDDPTCLLVDVEDGGVEDHQPPPGPVCGQLDTAGERPAPAEAPAGGHQSTLGTCGTD